MNRLGRVVGIGIIGAVGFGLYQLATAPPDLHLPMGTAEPPAYALGADDEKNSLVSFAPGIRMTFDSPKVIDLVPQSYADVTLCNGETGVFVGPGRVDNVCAVTFYRN